MPKSIPSRFFYDARGSELFERITELEEYYPTQRRDRAAAGSCRGDRRACRAACSLVEFGSGSSRKTDLLIEALPALASYVPIDISDAALAGAATRLRGRFPGCA